VVIAAAVQLAAPRAVHSAVVALVSVVGNVPVANPITSSGGPQPLVVQDGGISQPFSQQAICFFADQTCSVSLGGIPAGKTLVVRDVSGDCTTVQPALITIVVLNIESSKFLTQTWLSVSNANFVGGAAEVVFGRETYQVVTDSSATLNFLAETTSNSTGGSCTSNVSGYLVNQ
jgi:hypothetical protein